MERIDNKNPEDDGGWTPLHTAAKNGHLDVCKHLLDNIQNKMPKTLNGKTPAMVASENGHVEVSKYLNSEKLR